MMTQLKWVAAAGVMATATLSAQAAPTTLNFDAVAIGSRAPGVWYVDRTAPAGFESVDFDGDRRLKVTTNASGTTTGFYATQGRKYDLPTGIHQLSAQLWIDQSAADYDGRFAGLWGTGFDAAGAVSAYPIIEFAYGGFRFWDSNAPGSWTDPVVAVGNALDQWYTLAITLGSGGSFTYEVFDGDGDLFASHAYVAQGTSAIGNAIIQSYNHDRTASYVAYWDNLRYDVPEPGTLALGGLALLGGAFARRRRVR